MPNLLSVPVASLLNVLNIGQSKTDNSGTDTGADNFSALLNLGKNTDTNSDAPDTNTNPAPAVAAPIKAPVGLDSLPQPEARTTAPQKRDDAPRDDDSAAASPAPRADAKEDAPRTQPRDDNKEDTQTPRNADKAAAPARDDQPAPAKKAAPVDTKSTASDETPAAPEDEKNTGKKIKTELGDISQLLVSILQVLGVATPEKPAGNSDTAPATTVTGKVLQGADAANTAGSTLPQVATAPTVQPEPSLADLTAGVQQLLDLAGKTLGELKSREVTLTPVEQGTGKVLGDPITSITVPTGNQENIATLADALENHIAALSDLLQQLRAGAPATTATPAVALPQETSSPDAAQALPNITTTLPNVFAKLTEALTAVKSELALVPAPANDKANDKADPAATTTPSAASDDSLLPLPLTAANAQTSAPKTPLAPTAVDVAPQRPETPSRDDTPRTETASPGSKKTPASPLASALAAATPDAVKPATPTQSSAPSHGAAQDTPPATQAITAVDTKLNPAITPQVVVNNGNQPATIVNASQGANSDLGGNSRDSQQQSTAAPAAPTALNAPAENASSAYKSDFARTLEQAARAPIAEQVAFSIKTAASTGQSKISIQLNPEDLGKLEVKIHIDSAGKTGVVITADNKSTLELLQRDAQNLARSLNDAGLQTDAGSLSFNLRGGQQDAQQGQDFGRAQATQTYQKIQPEDEDDLALNVISRSYVVNLVDGLDIKI